MTERLKELIDKVKATIRLNIIRLEAELSCVPEREMSKIELEFQQVLRGPVITPHAVVKIDFLQREYERHRRRKETWDNRRLMDELIEWELALAQLRTLIDKNAA